MALARQAGADRLGGAPRSGARFNMPAAHSVVAQGIGRGALTRRDGPDEVCGWWKRDGLTVEPASWKPAV